MKIQELRIGNYIRFQNEHIYGCDLIDIKLSEIDRDPIKLTEDWLFKFGFLTESYIATGNFMIRGEKFVSIECNRGKFNYNIIISADDYDNWRFIVETNPFVNEHKTEFDFTLKPIKYVHELQNLYFALTGEELVVSTAVS